MILAHVEAVRSIRNAVGKYVKGRRGESSLAGEYLSVIVKNFIQAVKKAYADNICLFG